MSIPPLLTVDELRSYCRVEEPGEDVALLAMAAAAERHVESVTGRVLTRRTEFVRDTMWPAEGWELVRNPVLAVQAITYTDPAGIEQALAPETYVLEPGNTAWLRLRTGALWPEILPDSEIVIALDVGYPPGFCPPPLVQACLMLTGHFYDNRGAVNVGSAVTEMPLAVNALIAPYRLALIG